MAGQLRVSGRGGCVGAAFQKTAWHLQRAGYLAVAVQFRGFAHIQDQVAFLGRLSLGGRDNAVRASATSSFTVMAMVGLVRSG